MTTPLPLSEADERLARRLAAETLVDVRTARRYLRGENVLRTTRVALETAYRKLQAA